MRADICDASDDKAVEKFRSTLRRLGAQLGDKSWAMGTDIYELRIGNETLTIFSDEHSLDVEGSENLVKQVMQEFKTN